jgi:PAS domain S-box-containing protein
MRLVSYVPGSSFYGPLKDFRNISLIVYALALIFSAAGSNFLARSIIPRLRSGAAFAEAVVSGDISGHLDDSGSDEISGMFRAVNIMIDHLRKAIDTAKFQEKKALEASDELFMQNSLLEMTVEERTAELEQAEKHTRLILDMTTEAIFELDNKNMISFANSTALKMLGMDEPSVINRGFFDEALLETAQGSDGADNLIAAVESGEKKNLYNLWITTKNGGRIPVSISVSPIHRYDSRIGTIIAIIDLTEAIRAGKMIEALYESTEESYMFFSETFEPIDCNPAFVKLMKAQSKFQALEEFSSFFPPFQESGAASDQFFREITAKVRKDGGARFEWTLQDINGRVIPCLATMSLVEVNQQRINIASIHDLSGQKNAEKALTRQREQLQEILDSSPTSMMIIGDGVVRKINDNGIAMLGLRMGDSPQKMYVDSDQRKKMLAAIDIGELVKNWPVQMYSAGREILDTLASLHPFVYEGRASLLAWISDVTELTQAKILAEAAAEAKSDFLASMSHEIRTPMNAIIGLTHLCMQTNPNEKQANYLVKIQKAANVLLSIINDILDFSKIESGKFTLDSTPFRLREITKSLWDMIAFKAEEKGVKFSMNISPDIPEAFLGDPLRLSQVLINLCNNSIKFTEKGRIELDVSSSEIAEPVGELQIAELRFSVTDTGIGLTEEQSRKLFKPFTQADSSITRKYGGSGLGLSISKHLVESMDGRIWVESVFGEGSKFSFTVKLPVASSYEELKTANSKSEEETTGDADGEILPAPARVLLVEDNEINQEIAVELLTQFGATVDVAPNGAESIIMLGSSDYDIVFMDVQMPVMDGLEATRRIRTVMRYSKDDLPIIAMTAHAMKGDYEKSVAAGMNDHITKPIDPDRLYRTLKKWARPKRQENAG